MPSDERIVLLDALRGFALFGVLLVNMSGFKFPLVAFFYPSPEPYFPGILNEVARSAIAWLAVGKFMPIFSLLFGLGLVLQEKRAIAQGRAFGAFIRWRMGLLIAAGVMHGILLWPGEILSLYGLFGMLSPLLLRWNARMLGSLALAIGLISIGVTVYFTLANSQYPVSNDADIRAAVAQWIEAYRYTTLSSYLQLRVQEWKMVWAMTYLSSFSYSFLFFVLGLAVGKSNRLAAWLSPDFKTSRSFIAIVVLALSVTLAATIHHLEEPLAAPAISILIFVAFMIGNWIMVWGYMAGFARLHGRMASSGLMESLACVGRLSLTNYLLQSVIAFVIFMPFGFGFYGKVPCIAGIVFTVLTFAGQMIFSRWWLSRHQSGPAEHLWRLLSYPR